jgi:hypothetical protein
MNAKLFASDPRSFTLELVENQLVSVDLKFRLRGSVMEKSLLVRKELWTYYDG